MWIENVWRQKTQVTKNGIVQWKIDQRKIDEENLQLYGLVMKATQNLWIKLAALKNWNVRNL